MLTQLPRITRPAVEFYRVIDGKVDARTVLGTFARPRRPRRTVSFVVAPYSPLAPLDAKA
jgi:hypothetical protein